MDLSERISAVAAPAAASVGLVVDAVAVRAAGSRSSVVVTLDLPDDAVGSADLDAIAKASRAIGAALDEAGVPAGPYVLEVGTPGTDRPLTERRHFLRARTRLVTLTLVDGSSVSGRLLEIDDDEAVLETGRVALSTVKSGRIDVELKRLATEEDAAESDEEGGE